MAIKLLGTAPSLATDGAPKGYVDGTVRSLTTGTYTLNNRDIAMVDCTGGNVTLTLSVSAGNEYEIHRLDDTTNTLTINPSSGNIDGDSSAQLIGIYASVTLRGDGTNLRVKAISGYAFQFPRTGMIFPSVGDPLTPPPGFLFCQGQAVSRATYANLYAQSIIVESATLTSTSTTVTGSGYATAMPWITGVWGVEGVGIPSGTYIYNSGGTITLSLAATASGLKTLTYFPYGNGNGSTTFNVPDFSSRSPTGQFAGDATGTQFPIGQIRDGSHSHVLSDNGQAQINNFTNTMSLRRVATTSYNSNRDMVGSSNSAGPTANSFGAALAGTTDSSSPATPGQGVLFIIKT